ncbi:T9SS type A sorting domain-containing protein [candidate division WOR-3 bacterium]|nr:T9SS type A sorting domain-containing protein [candidate division WOR-3 bacterium]
MAVGDNGAYHLALSPSPPDAGVWYSRVRSWCAWDPPIQLGQLDVPAYSIAASQVSPAVCVVWADGYGNAIYRQSEDRGDAWSELTQLEAPVAFGGDTVTELSLFGLFPFFDSQGKLHVAAALYPVVRDTAYTNPAELWHWCPTNQPNWTRIHRAGCRPEHQQAGIGYNALYAGRPSLGQAADGRLYVAWEQFDSTNVEPQTNLLRAGIWVSGSADNGVSWRPGLLVTERNRFSHRFPCIVDRLIPGGPSGDTLCVLYMADSVAGFFVYAQGPGTHNPVLCQFVPGSALGIQRTSSAEVRTPNPGPTIVRGVLNLEAYSRQHTAYRAELLDVSGRRVLDLHPGANDVSRLAPGVYFVRAVAHESSVGGCRKVVIAR